MKSIYIENSADVGGERQRGEKCILAFTWKRMCASRGAEQPGYSSSWWLLNISMKHVLAEPITIVYPHPQALNSLALQIGGEVYLNYEWSPGGIAQDLAFAPSVLGWLHQGQLLLLRSSFLSNVSVFI